MKRLYMAWISFVLAGCAGVSLAQSNLTLAADADGCIQENKPTTGSATGRMSVRSRDVVGSGRQNISYIRFDLNVLADAPEANARFQVTRDASVGQSYSDGQIHVYGLLDTAGNTPQQWDEGITYNSSGLEVPGDGDATTQDLGDATRLQYIGDLPAAPGIAGDTVAISNGVLDTFIADRIAADGYMTLLLVEENAVDREVYFIHTESSSATSSNIPLLFVVGDLAGTVTDTNPPTVVATSPTNGAVDVDVEGDVSVQFSEPMNEASITTNSFVLYDALSNEVTAALSYNPGTLTATLNPAAWLDEFTTYTAVAKGGPGGVADATNNVMEADFAWSFTTGEAPVIDPNAPIVIETDADTYLTNGEGDSPPTANHGTKSQWEVRWYDNLAGVSRIHVGYVRFDITGVPASVLDSATLAGTFTSTSFDGPGEWTIWGLNDDVDGNNWTESGVTYATAAGIKNDDPPGTFNVVSNETTYLGTITLDGSATTNLPTFESSITNLDMTAFLEADTDGMVTFIIFSTEVDGKEYRIDSKEGNSADGHGPMTLNFQPAVSPPEATTIHGISASGASVSLIWDAVTGHRYTVERKSSLTGGSWVPLTTDAVTNSFTDGAPLDTEAYYRVGDQGL